MDYSNKATIEEIENRFDNDVERFSNLATGQQATVDAPLAMELITQAAVATTPGARRLLDVGCGSGILAIAAARLGASSVVALDTDRLATAATRDNAGRNGVAGQIAVYQGTLAALRTRPWDKVVVNILAPVIVTLLSEGELLRYTAADGRIVLSGIIDEQSPEVEEAIAEAGGEVEKSLVTKDWVTFVIKKNTP